MVSLNKPATPPEGCTVNLKVEPVNTIGHDHDGNRPKGTVTPTTLTIPGGSPGAASAEYKSPEVAGEEKIIAEIKGEKKGETTIQVKVPGLTGLGGGYYSLKTQPSSNKHTDVYNVQLWVNGLFNDIAYLYNTNFPDDEMLVVTDASLALGGLYDFRNTWNPPHNTHRIGTDIDVRSKNIPDDNREEFEKIVCKNYGFPYLEAEGLDNEHYHLFFFPYRIMGGYCQEIPL